MPYRALQLVARGAAEPVPVGEIIPDTYLDNLGNPHPVDFERLVELGAAELIAAKKPKKGAADPDPEAPPA